MKLANRETRLLSCLKCKSNHQQCCNVSRRVVFNLLQILTTTCLDILVSIGIQKEHFIAYGGLISLKNRCMYSSLLIEELTICKNKESKNRDHVEKYRCYFNRFYNYAADNYFIVDRTNEKGREKKRGKEKGKSHVLWLKRNSLKYE